MHRRLTVKGNVMVTDKMAITNRVMCSADRRYFSVLSKYHMYVA